MNEVKYDDYLTIEFVLIKNTTPRTSCSQTGKRLRNARRGITTKPTKIRIRPDMRRSVRYGKGGVADVDERERLCGMLGA